MAINVNLKVVSFGQIIFEISQPARPIEESPAVPAPEEIRYHEPQETASRIYEVLYEEQLRNYVVPLSTG